MHDDTPVTIRRQTDREEQRREVHRPPRDLSPRSGSEIYCCYDRYALEAHMLYSSMSA